MERMGPRRAAQENGDGTTAGRAGAVRGTAVAVAAAVAAVALVGCSVTVKPKNAAASSPLSSTPTPSAVASSTAPSTTASSSSAAPSTPAPSDVDHTVCTNVREVLANLKDKLETDKDSTSRSAQDYRTAGTALRTQDAKTDNAELKATLKTVGTDYQTVGHDIASHESADADLGKAADASKPLMTLCGGGGASSSGTGGTSSAGSTATSSAG